LQEPQSSGWRIKRDGGEFDQLTGASVTPRAIVKAVRETLEYYEANRAIIFSAVPDSEPEQ
jgi:electron transport complex protein RnfG